MKSLFKGRGWGRYKFVKRDEVLKIKRKDYLPGNVLTARCRMWNNIKESTEYGHFFARTRIGVERRSFLWNIKLFCSFLESLCEIALTSTELSMITMKLFPSSGRNRKTFILEVCAHDQMLKTSTFRLYLVDSSGNRTECLNDEFVFTETIRPALFTLNFSKEELMKNKNRYLQNDALQLYCECDIATGTVLQEIERASHGCLPSIQDGNLTTNDLESKKVLKEKV
ncbi:hypothetical protein TNIN_402671 [Trichonephila inaurata madagascariensis]|uniref:Uncharacterized protein n=1 Tax=Trichonephila inaurata madagascariensis TaxID=2747483 RepID=A0A8X7BV27_9ARAC|nr:hypothetical protein TNIN_402671 [Trichonephila inaurata madagascariensis]